MQITTIIERGVYKKCAYEAVETNMTGVNQAVMYDLKGYKCLDCYGSYGYVWKCKDLQEWIWFCRNSKCLKKGANISKNRKNSEDSQAKARNLKDSPFEYLPIRYREAIITGWTATDHYEKKVLSWVKNPKDFLLYIGPTNSGKTYFTCAIYNWFRDKWGSSQVAWIDAKRFKAKINASIEEHGPTPIINKILENRLIIFDDIAQFGATEWQKEIILLFVDYVYESNLPAVFTASMPMDRDWET